MAWAWSPHGGRCVVLGALDASSIFLSFPPPSIIKTFYTLALDLPFYLSTSIFYFTFSTSYLITLDSPFCLFYPLDPWIRGMD